MYPPSSALPKKHLLLLYLLATVPVISIFIISFFFSTALLKSGAMGIGLAILGFLLFAYPKIALYTAIFYIYSGLSYYFLKLHVAYPIVVIAFAAVLLRILSGEKIEFHNRLFNWSMALFTMIALTSMLYAHSPHFSYVGFSKYFKVLILTALAIQILKSPEDLHRFVIVVFVGAVVSVLLGLTNLQLGIARDTAVVGYPGIARFEGTHINPNRFAMYLVSALPMGIYAVKRSRRGFRALSFVGVFLLVLASLATFSRGAVFSLALIFLATTIREVKSKRFYIGILLIVVLIALLTPKVYWMRILSIGELGRSTPQNWSLYLRLRALESAVHLFLQHPLTGVGLNNFIVRSGTHLIVQIVSHNAYLEILVGVGVFGFLAFMGMFVSAIKDCWLGIRTKWNDRMEGMGDISFYLLISFITSMISCMFTSSEFAYFVWIPLASGLVVGNMVRRHLAEQNA